MRKIIIASFGTLDENIFNKTYFPLFSHFKNSGNVIPCFLNKQCAQINKVLCFDDIKNTISNEDDIIIFALILNYGHEYQKLNDFALKNNDIITSPLLLTLGKEISEYFYNKCLNKSVNYLLLAHGSHDYDNSLYYQIKIPDNAKIILHFDNTPLLKSDYTTIPFMLVNGRHIKKMNADLIAFHAITKINTGLLENDKFRSAIITKIEEYL